MPLMDDISAAQKEFDVAIKDMEAQKKQIDTWNVEYGRNGADFSKEVQRVVTALKDAKDNLQNWSEGYDSIIDTLKDYNKDFAAYKKKAVEAEKFYETLKDEKDQRDKARKKLGSKPSKEDEIADAAFKRVQTAYENDPGKNIEAVLKDVRNSAQTMEGNHRIITSELAKATKDYDELCKGLRTFADSTAVRDRSNKKVIEVNPMGTEFDKYFKRFK